MKVHGFSKYIYISFEFNGEGYADGMCLLPDDDINKKLRQLWSRLIFLVIFETDGALDYNKTEEVLTKTT
jgi:hypothetical protein